VPPVHCDEDADGACAGAGESQSLARRGAVAAERPPVIVIRVALSEPWTTRDLGHGDGRRRCVASRYCCEALIGDFERDGAVGLRRDGPSPTVVLG